MDYVFDLVQYNLALSTFQHLCLHANERAPDYDCFELPLHLPLLPPQR